MNIKLLTRMAGPDGNYSPGSIVSCDEKKANVMIKGGYAVAIDEPKIVEPQVELPKIPETIVKNSEKKPKKAVKKNVRK